MPGSLADISGQFLRAYLVNGDQGMFKMCWPRLVPLPTSMALLPFAVPADDVLPKSRADALAIEAADALPLTPFSEPPQPLEKAPGTLIRSERLSGKAWVGNCSANRHSIARREH